MYCLLIRQLAHPIEHRTALSIVLVMAGLGGCWWPLEIVPGWLRTAGHIFPTAWMMDGMHQLVSFGNGVEAILPYAAILLGYGLVFGLLGARFLKIQA